jgi:hypothetical protein
MIDKHLTFDELVATGWRLNEGKGVSKRKFTSVSFSLVRNGRAVKYVQGYGRTRELAIEDAVAEANAWLRAERIVQHHRHTLDPDAD